MATKASTIKTRPPAKKRKQLVNPICSMDRATFAKHFNARHGDSLADLAGLPEDMVFEVEQMYRAFHKNLHASRVDYEHDHGIEDEAESIDYAIECLIENHNWGWKELAGVRGHVAVFPDGKKSIATRINGVVVHHGTIEEATDRLLGIINSSK
jgi:hypothetical protein